jgi:NADP-dependent 3-hydroxy acid dehydrogenase YdfG
MISPDSTYMKTLIITGASGGIGGAIVDKFLSNGVR